MHKALQEFAAANGFTQEKTLLYGAVEDVYVTITPAGQTSSFCFGLACPIEKSVEAIRPALKATKLFGTPNVAQTNGNIIVTIRNTRKALKEESLRTLLTTTIGIAKQSHAVPNVNCVRCGKVTGDIALFNNIACPVCADCAAQLEQLNDSPSSPVSYITGLIGALIGAAIGAIPWVIAYVLGWILGILAFVIGLGAFTGYKLFRGPKKKGVALTMVYGASILMVLGAYVGLACFVLFSNGYVATLGNAFLLLGEPSIFPPQDFVFSAVLALLGLVGINKKVLTYTVPANARFIATRAVGETLPLS
ncbi:MAG: hypothetical protein LBN26_07540 [Christensenellaceae bacterium]|nr:hypothetical protein [Christensenellaceae bacterium]